MIYSPLKVVCALLAMLSVGMARPVTDFDAKLTKLENEVAKLEHARDVNALAKMINKLSAREKVRKGRRDGGGGGGGVKLLRSAS